MFCVQSLVVDNDQQIPEGMHCCSSHCRGAIIRRKLRKTDPFRPIEFARQAQKQFMEVNAAMQRCAS